MHQRTVLVVTFVRLVAALSLFYWPLWGFVVVVLLDWFDSYIVIHRLGFSRVEYQRWDKLVDWASQLVMVVMGSMHGLGVAMILLLLYRLIGHFVFIKTGNTKYFILFPNLIEPAFLWWVALPTFTSWSGFTAVIDDTTGLFILFVLKEIHEVVVHLGSPWAIRKLKQRGGYPPWMRRLGFHNLK